MLELDSERHAAVIFDCDGTLVDTMPLHFDAWKDAFRLHGATFEFTWEQFNARAGMTLERTVVELNQEFGCQLDPNLVADAQRASYLRRQDQIKPIAFVAAFASNLLGRIPIAIASGSNKTSVSHALSQAKMLDWFDVVVTANDVHHGKPAPDAFLLAARQLNVAPARCLVIEDGRLGIEAAGHAGMDAYLITREGSVQFCPNPQR
jgi:beta-phosphoglucomutase-like phosphatase (HAD superfamily)